MRKKRKEWKGSHTHTHTRDEKLNEERRILIKQLREVE